MRVAYERLIGLLAKYDKNRKIGINAFDPEYVKTIRIFLTSKTPQKEGALSIDAIEKLGNSLSLNSDFSPDPNSAAGQMYYELRELFNQNLDVIKLLKAESLLTEDNFALLDVNNMPNIFRSMKELNRLTQQNLNILKGAVKEKKSQLLQELQTNQEKRQAVLEKMAHYEVTRHDHTKDVPQEWLDKYNRMRNTVSNPVVPVVSGTCGGCSYLLTTQTLLSLGQNKMIQCSGCYRLLYKNFEHNQPA